MKIDWMFKKYVAPARDALARATAASTPPVAPVRAAKVAAPAPAAIDWQPRLRAAMGDDDALLALARESVPLDVKLAAVTGLTSEAALKLAEREFRSHDRRVHQLAKQRHLAQVARRVAREQAGALIEDARALTAETQIPLNRLVELDRQWQGLDVGLLDLALRDEAQALLAQLSVQTRERTDEALKFKRWKAAAQTTLAGLLASTAAAAAGTQSRQDMASGVDAARAALNSAAAEDGSQALCEALRSALLQAAALDEQLAIFDELLQWNGLAQTPAAAAPPSEPTGGEASGEEAPAPAASSDPLQRWQALAPLADAALADALSQRFEQWQQARDAARQTRRAERREQAKDQQRAVRSERIKTLAAALDLAEAALASGHLSETNAHLVDIDELLHGGEAAGPLRARIDALQAQYAQLKGWQHWGGGVARDELVQEAQTLAAATTAELAAGATRLPVKQLADAIDEMRTRWKELDRLGGATSRAMWQRFDGALKIAYEPVAAHVAALRATREQNLQARQALIETLDAVVLPVTDGLESTPFEWRTLAVALDQFQAEWRKLGPLEHTVPHKARDALVERMRGAMDRLEGPLIEARRSAQAQREQLIARAKAIGSETGTNPLGREVVQQVRELQGEWQQQAKAMPLARGAENAMWGEFKAAIDAIFSAREAVFNARDAEFKAYGAERTALIERLLAVGAETPASELKRTLAEVDAQWQRAGPAPRNEAVALDNRFRQAREAARQLLGSHAQRAWNASCDTLAAKLALCEEVEQSAAPAEAQAALAARWAALPALPAAWEQAMAQRAGLVSPPRGSAPNTRPTDELLLQLESALQLESPAAYQAARRDLKLLAMKAALEGRPSNAPAPLAPDLALAVLLGRKALDATQRQRLQAVLNARRERGA